MYFNFNFNVRYTTILLKQKEIGSFRTNMLNPMNVYADKKNLIFPLLYKSILNN